MKIGIPKELKNNENRVALTPAGALALTQAGHEVFVEKDAGLGSGFQNEEYMFAGANLVETAVDAWAQEMVIKVKEPIPSEYAFFRENLILFTYLHLAPEIQLTSELIKNKVIGIAYETVQLDNRQLPLLTPMSEVAGRMASQIGAQFLEKSKGGKGILLSGIPGVERAKVSVIGGGIVGTNAAKIAMGLGADVTILDVNPERLRQLDDQYGRELQTLMSNTMNIDDAVRRSDLVIGAVLIPGAKAPKLVSEKSVKEMDAGSVIVDVAIDQGGIFETIDRMTTHDHPTYLKHDILHYAVANMPGAVPRTSTIGLTNSTLPYVLQLANKGYKKACLENPALLKGINTLSGSVTYKAVAEAQAIPFENTKSLLENI
ncbi:alanine dehydrogenase [Bacillus sp. TS-2]|nr:alanine dehydrogenase [Bacillus sp. TS-2]